MQMIRLGDVLIQEGFLTEEQLKAALALQKDEPLKRLGEILVENRYITESQLLIALAKRLQMRVVDFRALPIEMEAVALIPKALCQKYNLIAIALHGERVTVAVNDPLDLYAIEDVKSVLNRPCDIVLAARGAISAAIEANFAELEAHKAAKIANLSVGAGGFSLVEELNSGEDDTPVVSFLNSVLLRGHTVGASDIHIEPFEKTTIVRMRVDGQLVDYVKLAPSLHLSLVARIKILSDLDIAERRLPQDGHFRVKVDGIELNIRVSVMPTVFGEKVVMRFLTQTNNFDYANQFGMTKENYIKTQKILRHPHGILYITGPTGSGKTTTLYMILEQMIDKPVNICTIEDPVEKNLARINQTQVNNGAGLTFSAGLRSLLRQDPDVIMVGETRDSETASIAVSAAITGHLVLSTLHTNDAISAIVRLEDMGVENYLLANSLVGVVAQRLVKKICLNCKEEYQPDALEKELLGEDRPLYRGRGCHMCNNTGYHGRIAIHEVIEINNQIRTKISRNAPIDEIYTLVEESGQATFLHDQMLELVRQGISTTEELLKVASYRD